MPELPKMGVQGNGRLDPQLVDDNLAGAIGEAPAGRGALLKEEPRTADLVRREEMYPGHARLKQGTSDFHRAEEQATGGRTVSVSSTQ